MTRQSTRQSNRIRRWATLLCVAAVPAIAIPAKAAEAPAAKPAAASATESAALAKAQALVDKGVEFLKSQQNEQGGWTAEGEPPAMTAMVLRAIVGSQKYSTKDEFVSKGYQALLSHQLDNGGIYKDMLANYNTAIAVSALAAANDPALKPQLDKAVAYLKGLQFTDKSPTGPKGEKVEGKENPWFGGMGYGKHGRPDGSNTQIAIEALKEAGLKEDDPAFQAALQFVTRMQNRSESNDQAWVGDDGGFVYTPANNGESQAGEYVGPDGKRMLRSYGSMTYAGLKSMIYAGLTKDDPRVQAAWDWITKNWTLEKNPGMELNSPEAAQNGLFYYYHTFARALNVYNEPVVTDSKGAKHDWRVELVDKLASLQKENGSWEGDKRWMESNPRLATSYAVLALQEVIADLKEHPAK